MNIYESIAAVMSEIGAVGKNSKNTTQGFMFRGIDAVMNALAPALIKNKLFVVPEILEQTREERTNQKGTTLIYSICKIRYTFYAEDGSNVSAVVIGEGMDTGDKATNKAMSIAFKYACFQVFCIPTEEMVDPDQESHEVKKKAAQNVGKKQLETVSETYITEIKALFDKYDIDTEFVFKLYGIKAYEEITRKQYENMTKNIEKIKQKQEEQ